MTSFFPQKSVAYFKISENSLVELRKTVQLSTLVGNVREFKSEFIKNVYVNPLFKNCNLHVTTLVANGDNLGKICYLAKLVREKIETNKIALKKWCFLKMEQCFGAAFNMVDPSPRQTEFILWVRNFNFKRKPDHLSTNSHLTKIYRLESNGYRTPAENCNLPVTGLMGYIMPLECDCNSLITGPRGYIMPLDVICLSLSRDPVDISCHWIVISPSRDHVDICHCIVTSLSRDHVDISCHWITTSPSRNHVDISCHGIVTPLSRDHVDTCHWILTPPSRDHVDILCHWMVIPPTRDPWATSRPWNVLCAPDGHSSSMGLFKMVDPPWSASCWPLMKTMQKPTRQSELMDASISGYLTEISKQPMLSAKEMNDVLELAPRFPESKKLAELAVTAEIGRQDLGRLTTYVNDSWFHRSLLSATIQTEEVLRSIFDMDANQLHADDPIGRKYHQRVKSWFWGANSLLAKWQMCHRAGSESKVLILRLKTQT